MKPITTDPAIRVWRMNDCEWIAARTKTEAIDCLIQFTGTSRAELELENIVPLTQRDLKRLTFITEDEEPDGSLKRHSFLTELQRLIAIGTKFPTYFATTEI